MTNRVEDLTELFTETRRAHHHAYIQSDGDDPEWPLWYADYLFDKLPPLLDKEITKSELVYAMVLLSREQPEVAPETDWAVYYAEYFLQHYG